MYLKPAASGLLKEQKRSVGFVDISSLCGKIGVIAFNADPFIPSVVPSNAA